MINTLILNPLPFKKKKNMNVSGYEELEGTKKGIKQGTKQGTKMDKQQ